jgi:hypothetical protein
LATKKTRTCGYQPRLSRSRISIIAGLLLALFASACTGKHDRVTVQNEEEDTAPRLASTVPMNDPKAAAQLLTGFYPIENNAWRWTAGKFSVRLRTPPGAGQSGTGQSGAALSFSFAIPDVVIRKDKNITLAASVNGMALKSTTYNAPGTYAFSADVPASALAADNVTVDFALDKTMQPEGDKRELGVIAISVGLSGK